MEQHPLTQTIIYNISHYYIPHVTEKFLELKISKKKKSYKCTLCGPPLKRYSYSNFKFYGHTLSAS
jgi:hypothetical protein